MLLWISHNILINHFPSAFNTLRCAVYTIQHWLLKSQPLLNAAFVDFSSAQKYVDKLGFKELHATFRLTSIQVRCNTSNLLTLQSQCLLQQAEGITMNFSAYCLGLWTDNKMFVLHRILHFVSWCTTMLSLRPKQLNCCIYKFFRK